MPCKESLKDFAIYLDMDGVLADYDAGIRALGFDIDPTHKNDLNRSGTGNPLKREMHEAIKGTRFYATLPILPGALTLYHMLSEADPIILTAAPKFGATEDDYYLNPYWLGAAYYKRHWVERLFLPRAHFGNDVWAYMYPVRIADERFICTTSAQKFKFMHRKKAEHQVLFDDRIANCRAWAEAGGFAILYDGDPIKAVTYLHFYRSFPAAAMRCDGGVAGAKSAFDDLVKGKFG